MGAHEAIVAAGDAGRWRVGYAGLRLVKAGPTGGATMQQVEDHAAQLLERNLGHAREAAPSRGDLPIFLKLRPSSRSLKMRATVSTGSGGRR